MVQFFVLLFGLCIGSFLNVCIYRIPKGESVVPSSHCMKCGYGLKWYDLIPVISYISYRGKCRKCGDSISLQYPLVEVLNGIVYLLIFLEFGFGVTLFRYCIMASFILVLAVIDYNTQYVYSAVSFSAIGTSVVFLIIMFLGSENISTYILAAIVGIIVFGGINIFSKIVYKRVGFGGGDVEVIIAIALTLGFKLFVLSFFLSVIFGAVISLFLISMKRIKRENYVPFVPFLYGGMIATMLVGEEIINWYMAFIGV